MQKNKDLSELNTEKNITKEKEKSVADSMLQQGCPLVSVIMPVYNAGRFLKDAIQDILYQTYENLELICVDDGSTDQSPEVLAYFAECDNRLKIIRTENKGAGAARNRGLDEAKGKYLIFLDADDRFEPQLIEHTIKRAEETEADIVIYDAGEFDSNTFLDISDDYDNWILNLNYLPKKEVFSYKDCPNYIFQISAPLMWNKLLLHEFIDEIGAYYQQLPYNNDSYFACHVMTAAQRITALNEKLVYYRINSGISISRPEFKRKNPQYNYEMLIAIKQKMQNMGIYSDIWRSLSKFAFEHLRGHILCIDENNYEKIIELIEKGYIKEFGFEKLNKDDFEFEEQYLDLNCLAEKGYRAFTYRIIYRLVNDREIIKNLWMNEKLNSEKTNIFYFDLNRIDINKAIVLYGAGNRGKQLYKTNLLAGKYKIVGWVDKNAEAIGTVSGVKIINAEMLEKLDFDYVVIAIDDIGIMKEVKEFIKQYVPQKKIVW